MMTADSRSPKLAVMSSARSGQWRSRWMPCSVSRSSASSASTSARSGRAASDQPRRRRAVAPRDLLEQLVVAGIRPLGHPRAFEQLIGDTLKRRYHDDDRLAALFVEQDAADVADRAGVASDDPPNLRTFIEP